MRFISRKKTESTITDKIKNLYQYALRFRSNVEVIIQYGKMDITQDNLAYIGLLGYTG